MREGCKRGDALARAGGVFDNHCIGSMAGFDQQVTDAIEMTADFNDGRRWRGEQFGAQHIAVEWRGQHFERFIARC